MTLAATEFIRRFLLHILPRRLHEDPRHAGCWPTAAELPSVNLLPLAEDRRVTEHARRSRHDQRADEGRQRTVARLVPALPSGTLTDRVATIVSTHRANTRVVNGVLRHVMNQDPQCYLLDRLRCCRHGLHSHAPLSKTSHAVFYPNVLESRPSKNSSSLHHATIDAQAEPLFSKLIALGHLAIQFP